jgi:CheY-like chemotaxis protein
MTRVLYIEDEPNNRMLVRRLFMAMASDLTYTESDNARTGIQMAIDTPPDIILMDISMPDMDGLTATKLIRQTPSIKDTPIIALTANAMEGDRERFLAAGCDGYISKPIDIDTFIDNVRDYIKRIPEILKKRSAPPESAASSNGAQARPATQSARPADWDAKLAAMKQANSAQPVVTPTPMPVAEAKPVVTPAPVAEVKPDDKGVNNVIPATPVTAPVAPLPAAPPTNVTPVAPITSAITVTPSGVPAGKPDSQGESSPKQAASTSSEPAAPVTPKSQDAAEAKPVNTPDAIEVKTAQQEISSNGGGQ